MRQDWPRDVLDFSLAMKPDFIRRTPGWPNDEILYHKMDLIIEEINELHAAVVDRDLTGTADAIGDAVYVLLGFAIALGIDMGRVWDEIHRTNMDKRDGPLRADGKRLKPPGWSPPQIQRVLDHQEPLVSESALQPWIDRHNEERRSAS